MAKAKPLYTLEQQFQLLDQDIPTFNVFNVIRFRLLVACSDNGSLDVAKTRFLNLIQDTEMRTIFSSILETPELRIAEGVKPIQQIHQAFKSNYSLVERALRDLSILGVPNHTINLLNDYFYSNQDPVYKLSIMATIVMVAYLKDDEVNNRKE